MPLHLFDPTRTMYLRGFDRRGAGASLHSATETSFELSGVFNDFADFAVVVLFDADNQFEHYAIRHVPAFDLENVVVSFDLSSGNSLQGIDSVKNPWIAWDALSYIRADGTSGEITLIDHAMFKSGVYSVAYTEYELVGTPIIFDRITIFYRDTPFDYLCAGGETLAAIRDNLIAQINNYNWNVEGPAIAIRAENPSGNTIRINAARYGTVDTNGTTVTWQSGIKFYGASGTIRINGTDYLIDSVTSPTTLTLTTSAGVQNDVTYTSDLGGADGNFISLRCSTKATTTFTVTGSESVGSGVFRQRNRSLSGGSSDVTWNVSLDFTALGIDSLRQCWLTFAPKQPLPDVSYTRSEWDASISNIVITDLGNKTILSVPSFSKSTVVSSRDKWATYTGTWSEEKGYWYLGYAKRSVVTDNTVSVFYSCQYAHDLYLGTYLYTDQGIVGISIDGGGETTLDLYLNSEPGLKTTRKVGSSLSAGTHTVTFRVTGTKNASSSNYYVYFDYLQAAVLGDVEPPQQTYTDYVPAISYDTERTYKPSPQRLIWALQAMGFVGGDVNNYLGIFWANQRYRVGGTDNSYAVSFSGTWAAGEACEVVISGVTTRKTLAALDVDPGDADIARIALAASLANFINSEFAGVRAVAVGSVLTVYPQTWDFAFTVSSSETSVSGSISASGNLNQGTEGDWTVDDSGLTPAGLTSTYLNHGVRMWLSSYFTECFFNGFTTTIALSMELVNPDEGPRPWGARYSDDSLVETSSGFGGLFSTHLAFNCAPNLYAANCYWEIAELMDAAGLNPRLQFGEYLWWFFAGGTPLSMAFYDAETEADASVTLGTAMPFFASPQEDPLSLEKLAALTMLAGRLNAYCAYIKDVVTAEYPDATFELLFATDVTRNPQYVSPIVASPQGGNVNLLNSWPVEFDMPSTAPFDVLKIECLSWGVTYRNIDLIKEGLKYPLTGSRSWTRPSLKYLMPLFDAGVPRRLEYLAASAMYPTVNLFAIDHLAIFGWPLKKPE